MKFWRLRFLQTICIADSGSEEENEIPLLQRAKAPLFEAFWQGRLIPGARIESLPFIEASNLDLHMGTLSLQRIVKPEAGMW